MLLGEAIKEFLIAGEADGLSAKTLIWYESILKSFYGYMGDRQIEELTTKDIRLYINSIRGKYVEDTAHAHIRVQHRFWVWSHKEWDLTNPMRNIKYPSPPKQKVPKAIAVEDITKMYLATGDSWIGIRDRAILALLSDTGIRSGGVVGLKMENLILERRQAIVTEKGGKTRSVVFSPFTLAILELWISMRVQAETLFYNYRYFTPLTTDGLYLILKRLAEKSGVTGRFNPHSFRHRFALEYLLAGGDLATLQRLMGHEDPETTLRYYAIFASNELAEHHEEYSLVRHLVEGLRKAG